MQEGWHLTEADGDFSVLKTAAYPFQRHGDVERRACQLVQFHLESCPREQQDLHLYSPWCGARWHPGAWGPIRPGLLDLL